MDDYDLAFARYHWYHLPLAERWLRKQGLDALAWLAPDILTEARDPTRTPAAVATAWLLVTPDRHPVDWAVGAIIWDRTKVAGYWPAPPEWRLEDHPPLRSVHVVLPDNDRRRQIGDTLYRAEVEAAMQAQAAADPFPPPPSLTDRDSNLKRDLMVWADAVVRETGRTPTPWADDCLDVPAEPSRVVKRMAERLGLAPPRGRGRRHP
jgi:hypothetical protein